MHVLIIPSWYKTTQNPVVGSFFEEQARGLINSGYKVGVIYPSFYSFSSGAHVEDYVIDDRGIPTYYCSYKAIIPRCYKFNYTLFAKKIYQTYLKYVKENGTPTIIHAHTVFYGGIAAEYISSKTKIPFVITEHFTSFVTGGIVNQHDLNIACKIYSHSKYNIVVSHGFKTLLTNRLNISEELFHVIPNMVDNRFFEKPLLKKIDKVRPVFFTMSFLTERKNHKLMFDAFALLLKHIPEALFLVGGDGKIRNELESYVLKIGIQNNVSFLGELTREEVANEMSNCDIFLLASKFETFGVVLIEALAAGKPIITSDSVGPRDIVNKQNGIIISKVDAVKFQEAMLKMVDENESYDSNMIRNDCKKRFSENVIIDNLKQVYQSLLSL